jgi:hypothetical protein
MHTAARPPTCISSCSLAGRLEETVLRAASSCESNAAELHLEETGCGCRHNLQDLPVLWRLLQRCPLPEERCACCDWTCKQRDCLWSASGAHTSQMHWHAARVVRCCRTLHRLRHLVSSCLKGLLHTGSNVGSRIWHTVTTKLQPPSAVAIHTCGCGAATAGGEDCGLVRGEACLLPRGALHHPPPLLVHQPALGVRFPG